MSSRESETLKRLIERFSPEEEESYLKYLPEEEAAKVRGISARQGPLDALLKEPWEGLFKMHYSWLIDALKKLSGPQQYFTIAALPEEQREKLARQLQIATPPADLPKPLRALFLRPFFERLGLPELPDPQFVSQGNFKALGELSREKLLDCVDCLAMFDVAGEIRQIVDREQLHRLIKSLSPLQQRFLKVALRMSCKWSPVPLGLVSWAGDPVKLLRSLHRRGLMRLAFALTPDEKEFLLHLARKMDVKRAKVLEEYADEERPKEAKATLEEQLKQTLRFINDQESV